MAPAHRFVYRLPSLFRIYSERMCAIMKISEGRALSELCNPIRLVFSRFQEKYLFMFAMNRKIVLLFIGLFSKDYVSINKCWNQNM